LIRIFIFVFFAVFVIIVRWEREHVVQTAHCSAARLAIWFGTHQRTKGRMTAATSPSRSLKPGSKTCVSVNLRLFNLVLFSAQLRAHRSDTAKLRRRSKSISA
jgi:hypothetical protein